MPLSVDLIDTPAPATLRRLSVAGVRSGTLLRGSRANKYRPISAVNFCISSRRVTETRDGTGVVFDVPDLGQHGSGTVVSEFVAHVPTNDDPVDELPLGFGAAFELTEDGLWGADYELNVDRNVVVPVDPDG